MLIGFKCQTVMNKHSREDKDDGEDDDEQRGKRVQQKVDFNSDPETLKDDCSDISQSKMTEPKQKGRT